MEHIASHPGITVEEIWNFVSAIDDSTSAYKNFSWQIVGEDVKLSSLKNGDFFVAKDSLSNDDVWIIKDEAHSSNVGRVNVITAKNIFDNKIMDWADRNVHKVERIKYKEKK